MVPCCHVGAPQPPHTSSCLGRGGCQQLAQRCQRLGEDTVVTVLLGYAHSLIQRQQSFLQGRGATGARHRLGSTREQGCTTTDRHSLTRRCLQYHAPMVECCVVQDAKTVALLVGAFQTPTQQRHMQGTAPEHGPALPAWLPR